jgi:hypothetical protein
MRIVRRRGELVAEGIAGTIVDHEQVGEGAADIDSDAQRSRHATSITASMQPNVIADQIFGDFINVLQDSTGRLKPPSD